MKNANYENVLTKDRFPHSYHTHKQFLDGVSPSIGIYRDVHGTRAAFVYEKGSCVRSKQPLALQQVTALQ